MKTYDVAILTESRYANPQQTTPYIQNILTEDGLVQKAIEKLGLKTIRLDWADKDFDWNTTRFALFRTTWDYFHRFQEFQQWLDKTALCTQFINSVDLVRWNMDKHYLLDLEGVDIRIPETIFLEKGTTASLKELYEQQDWHEMILKPTVSGTARHTYRLNAENLEEHQSILSSLLDEEAMMLQPFLTNIVDQGEMSLMIIGGQYTHAVLKVAKAGDFRVQDDFGGSLYPYTPKPNEIEFAEAAVKACPTPPLYARVDICYDNDNQLVIGELEIIEPELWFRKNPSAADQLAQSIRALF